MNMNMNMNMNVNVNDLRARFSQALSEAGVQRSGTALFQELLARYGEAHRHYHTIAHVDACLGFFDWYRGLALHPERVELALWFHDAVYDPRASDNESRSAELARASLDELGAPAAVRDEVAAHVLATRGHQGDQPDTKLLLDLDLSVLGARPLGFAQFEQQIREEYAHVSDEVFAAGRCAVLSGFAARSEIYATPALREELEFRARQNLQQRMRELTAHE